MAIPLIYIIDRTLRDAGIAVDGVSVGSPSDRSTWKVQYNVGATSAQQVQGDALLLSMDVQDPTVIAEVKNDLATRMNDDALQAVAEGLWEAIPAPLLTKAQLKTRIFQLYRSKL